MSVHTGKPAARQKVSPVVIAIAVVLLAGFVAWRGWAAFAGPQAGPLPPPPTQDINYISQMARATQGDFNKLSPDDQAKVQKITHGWGQSALVGAWRKAQKEKSQ